MRALFTPSYNILKLQLNKEGSYLVFLVFPARRIIIERWEPIVRITWSWRRRWRLQVTEDRLLV
jgi:hypothetical protein